MSGFITLKDASNNHLDYLTGSSSFEKIQLIVPIKYNLKSLKKHFKNSTVYPSLPGDLLFFMFLST